MRKQHTVVEQHYYLDYVRDYGPTTLEEFVAAFDVHPITARRKLDGLVSQGKLAVTLGRFSRLDTYFIPQPHADQG